MRRRLLRLFGLTWFGFALFYSTTMTFVLDRPTRELIVPAAITGFFVASLTALLEWLRLRHKDRAASEDRDVAER